MDNDNSLNKLIKSAETGNAEAQYNLGISYFNGRGVENDDVKAVFWFQKAALQGLAKAQCDLASCYLSGIGVDCDYEQAVMWFQKAALQGNDKAQCYLGNCYYDGTGVKQDFEQAVIWHTKAAEQGFASAQTNLGAAYASGEGIRQDYKQAFEWYIKAAEQNNATALLNVAFFYERGIFVEENMEEALKWYRKSAEQGHAHAATVLENYGIIERNKRELIPLFDKAEQGDEESQVILGKIYCDGSVLGKDYEQAGKWFEKAARQGNTYAQYELGSLYYKGEGVDCDHKNAAEWMEKSANQGNASAMYTLGRFYYAGEGVEQDYSIAFKWFERAAELGQVNAQNQLGYCYCLGEGIQQNYTEAVKWYKKAAEQGNEAAQNGFGQCYYHGFGLKQDFAEAAKWYEKAAEQGFETAQFNLGNCYFHGQGVEQNYEKAVEWFTKAAMQGVALAQNNLANCYSSGYGVKQDSKIAFSLFQKAAEQGLDIAQNTLAHFYFEGKGVQQDYGKAIEWYTRAAEQGYAFSQYFLGFCYFTANGVAEDNEKALYWLTKAAESENPDAQYILGTIYYKGEIVEKDMRQALILLKRVINNHTTESEAYRRAKDLIESAVELSETIRSEGVLHRTEVFISYTHKDKKYFDELKVYLDSLMESGIEVWHDGMIKTGSNWKKEIRTHMTKAKVAILMVSQNYLVSDFIRNEELPELLQAAADEQATIIWIPVSISNVENTIIKGKKGANINIADYQAIMDPKKPLENIEKNKRKEVYMKLIGDIASRFNAMEQIENSFEIIKKTPYIPNKQQSQFLFITANENEKEAFEMKFVKQGTNYVKGAPYHYGSFGNYPAAWFHMFSQGTSNSDATILCGQIIKEVTPVAVIMVGIAFGADGNNQKIGDVLVSKLILNYDSRKERGNDVLYKESPKEVGFQLLNGFNSFYHGFSEWSYPKEVHMSEKFRVIIGAMLSGSALIDDYSFRQKLLDDFSDYRPVGGEMEAYGIYAQCRLSGISEWIIIKAICDWGYDKQNSEKEKWQRIAADSAVNFCHTAFSLRGGNGKGIFDDLIIINDSLS